MAVAGGNCPSCGAPIEFSVGSSIAKVCEFCHSTIYRSDRGLSDLGKVAAIANTPSLVSVGDEGTLGDRAFRVAGRVQLDHGAGPWDEYHVAFGGGVAWGWLAYAEGVWYVTSLVTEPLAMPSFETLHVESDISLGRAGIFRIAEVKTGRVVSAEGELPARLPPGFPRSYADLAGADRAFATLDYGDRREGWSRTVRGSRARSLRARRGSGMPLGPAIEPFERGAAPSLRTCASACPERQA